MGWTGGAGRALECTGYMHQGLLGTIADQLLSATLAEQGACSLGFAVRAGVRRQLAVLLEPSQLPAAMHAWACAAGFTEQGCSCAGTKVCYDFNAGEHVAVAGPGQCIVCDMSSAACWLAELWPHPPAKSQPSAHLPLLPCHPHPICPPTLPASPAPAALPHHLLAYSACLMCSAPPLLPAVIPQLQA